MGKLLTNMRLLVVIHQSIFYDSTAWRTMVVQKVYHHKTPISQCQKPASILMHGK